MWTLHVYLSCAQHDNPRRLDAHAGVHAYMCPMLLSHALSHAQAPPVHVQPQPSPAMSPASDRQHWRSGPPTTRTLSPGCPQPSSAPSTAVTLPGAAGQPRRGTELRGAKRNAVSLRQSAAPPTVCCTSDSLLHLRADAAHCTRPQHRPQPPTVNTGDLDPQRQAH
jgi:hypothetical protein